MGGLTFEYFGDTRASAFIRDLRASSGSNRFPLVYVCHGNVDLCDTPQVVPVSLVRSAGSPIPVGSYLGEILLKSVVIALDDILSLMIAAS